MPEAARHGYTEDHVSYFRALRHIIRLSLWDREMAESLEYPGCTLLFSVCPGGVSFSGDRSCQGCCDNQHRPRAPLANQGPPQDVCLKANLNQMRSKVAGKCIMFGR